MKSLNRALPLLIIASAVFWLNLTTDGAPVITPVPDEVAADVRGGGCGSTYKLLDPQPACSGTKTVREKDYDCSSIAATTAKTSNGDGDQVPDGEAKLQCFVCDAAPKIQCGNDVMYTSSTKNCNRSR